MKKIWHSKTIWANILSIIGILITARYGVTIDVETQALALGFVNIALRLITNEGLTTGDTSDESGKPDGKN